MNRIVLGVSLICWWSTAGGPASVCAQSSSLYGAPLQRTALTLDSTSWSYQPVDPPRELQLHDIVTIMVDEKARAFSQGDLTRRRNANLNAALLDWIRLDGLDIKTAPQNEGDPRTQGTLTSQFRAQNTLDSRDNLQLRIAAEVVDIRPNGNLVLEARREIINNEERWKYALSGIVRRDDVLPNNTVLSEDIADMRLEKIESGQIRDGYKRSWLMRVLDRYSPF